MSAPTALHTAASSIDTDALTTAIDAGTTQLVDQIDTNTQPIRDSAISVLNDIPLAISPLLEEADEAFHDVCKLFYLFSYLFYNFIAIRNCIMGLHLEMLINFDKFFFSQLNLFTLFAQTFNKKVEPREGEGSEPSIKFCTMSFIRSMSKIGSIFLNVPTHFTYIMLQ